ncbi:DUF4041 domain-containing protein [Dyadobacter fanqingshengii]|uniref:DUF4041 domain-containing protein n=1 Tax=Dyadobacter fanqingshengii TaxID=2906443 RepID=A0A9X1TA93_9BACT|nr:DUF4041 domain-containing protein [Dyadobacter fanqingshengii]MCF0041481.1 DUF4041 domain-containing protein [Dyadobacter fanqingshengii]USJ36800.1 DUF4041 domain-containing protein [Dyadobacter fanqingshengii]
MGFFDFLKKREIAEIENLKKQLEFYRPIINVDEAAQKCQSEIEQLEIKRNELSKGYDQGLDTYTSLRKEISLFESKLDLIEYGIYEPVYDFEKSDEYRETQKKIIEKQKDLIKNDRAAICSAEWTIEGSALKGRVVINRFKKLMLRAFNGESSALISKVKWNNVVQMSERLSKSYADINKLGEGFKVSLSIDYLKLKKSELTLEYEYQAKRQQEKENMQAIQEELREEEKARREFEQAQREAEKQEAVFLNALEKARLEMGLVSGEEYDKMNSKIAMLEIELALAREKKERALSMAQQTKRGHVYIISNIGSFGENVFKIGMTRRLEPNDRIRELGDASVPFKFDVHAMIYSDEARTLEYELHKAFSDKKVNMLNYRREFFNVSLEEIEHKISELGFKAEFTAIPEAMEFRETLLVKEQGKLVIDCELSDESLENEFPRSLF